MGRGAPSTLGALPVLTFALALTLWLLAAPTSTVAVVDVSRPDAVYQDVSRGLAEDVAAALAHSGLSARRVDESELASADGSGPGVDFDGTCRSGPCLEGLARRTRAQALVLLDANEKAPEHIEVALMALDAATGRPLAVSRYPAGKRAPAALRRFATQLARALAPRGDGGALSPR